jgi:hypothetical protein
MFQGQEKLKFYLLNTKQKETYRLWAKITLHQQQSDRRKHMQLFLWHIQIKHSNIKRIAGRK